LGVNVNLPYHVVHGTGFASHHFLMQMGFDEVHAFEVFNLKVGHSSVDFDG
jgi:hypothetical protein